MESINVSNSVSETEFQELFTLYWNVRPNPGERLYVINELNKYIYSYITSRYRSEFDLASEFFLENIKKTEQLIEEYDPSYQISFLAYIRSRIRRRYINYRFRQMRYRRLENVNEYHELKQDFSYRSVFEPAKDYHAGYGELLHRKLDLCLCQLKMDEEIAVRMNFCFRLGYREFRFLKRKTGKTDFLAHYRNYLDHIGSRIQEERASRGRIAFRLYKSTMLAGEGSGMGQGKRLRLIREYYRVKNPVPLRLIAAVLETNITNVHRKIKKACLKLQRYMKEPVLIEDSTVRPVISSDAAKKAA